MNIGKLVNQVLGKNPITECPECAAELVLTDDVIKGEIMQCGDCGVELEVMSLNPVKVELAPEEDEDWGE